MAEYDYEYEELAIHDGFEDQMAKTNKTEVGSVENLNAWKAMAIRHDQELKEIELSEKMRDMEERRAIEREKLELERNKAEAESIDRALQAKAESKKNRWMIGLSLASFGVVFTEMIFGWMRDKPDSEMIRNSAEERDRSKVFNIGKDFIKSIR